LEFSGSQVRTGLLLPETCPTFAHALSSRLSSLRGPLGSCADFVRGVAPDYPGATQ